MAGQGYIKGLDGLRAIAVGLVLAAHSGAWEGLRGEAWFDRFVYPLVLGENGVLIFFALSGFLITHLLLREWAATGRIHYGYFLLRRALRLFPAFMVFWLILLLLTVTGFYDIHPASFAFSAVYLYNFIPKHFYSGYFGLTWSLGVEEQFYLVWPLVVRWVLRRGRSLRDGALDWSTELHGGNTESHRVARQTANETADNLHDARAPRAPTHERSEQSRSPLPGTSAGSRTAKGAGGEVKLTVLALLFLLASFLFMAFIPSLQLPDLAVTANGENLNLSNYSLGRVFFPYRWFVPMGSYLLLGCTAAVWAERWRTPLSQSWGLPVVGLLLFLAPWYAGWLDYFPQKLLQTVGFTLVILWIFYRQDSPLVRVLEFAPLRHLGRLSYGLYLYSGIYLATGISNPEWWWQTLPVALVLTYFTALASHFTLERWFLKKKSRFRSGQVTGGRRIKSKHC